MKQIHVMMGRVELGFDDDMLCSLGLGSCIGIVLYHPGIKIAALGHIMLPDSSENRIVPADSRIVSAISDGRYQEVILKAAERIECKIIPTPADRLDLLRKYNDLLPDMIILDSGLAKDMASQVLKNSPGPRLLAHCSGFSREVYSELIEKGVKDGLFAPYSVEAAFISMRASLYDHLLRYADIMVPYMIEKLAMIGLPRAGLVAKMAGGGQMFPELHEDLLNIGIRNSVAVRAILQRYNIPLLSEQTGGNSGRSLFFDVAAQHFTIKTKEMMISI